MRSSLFLVSALSALVAALPTAGTADLAAIRRDTDAPADTTAANCLASVAFPAAAAALPAPDTATNLVLIAQGRGTQNYTCASETAVPVAIGAVADLFNVSCSTGVATQLGSIQEVSAAAAIGQHFFVDTTTPDFNVAGLGNTELKKSAAIAAPTNTNGDVPWLLLTAQAQGTTGQIKAIYRLRTSGGSAPATCAGQAANSVVTVPYQAQYWFYSS